MAISALEIAKPVAKHAADVAIASAPDEWCHSILFPLGYFTREVIEAVEIIGGVRRIITPLEVVRIDFNLLDFPSFALEVRKCLIDELGTNLDKEKYLVQNLPEGISISLANYLPGST